MSDYPTIKASEKFSITITCDSNITQNPVAPNFSAPIWVASSTASFTLHSGLDFGSFTYAFVFVSNSNGVVATVDATNATISVAASNRLMIGSY